MKDDPPIAPEPELQPDRPAPKETRERRPGGAIIVVVPILLVLITFLFWYQTWFGRQLTDREMGQYLSDTLVPHKTQHALTQLAARIARGDPATRRWYPEVLKLAESQEPQFRLMAAWLMGQDNQSEDFHQALRKLVKDPEPMVRRNAALALVRFGDAAGDSELRLMLRPFTLVAPQGGYITFRLKEQDSVGRGSVVARIRSSDGAEPVEVRSPVAGQVERRIMKDGAKVAVGEEIAILSPAEEQVWESLRGLYLIGTRDDLRDVELYARGAPGMSERVRQQATPTLEAIRRRAATSHK